MCRHEYIRREKSDGIIFSPYWYLIFPAPIKMAVMLHKGFENSEIILQLKYCSELSLMHSCDDGSWKFPDFSSIYILSSFHPVICCREELYYRWAMNGWVAGGDCLHLRVMKVNGGFGTA